MTTTTDTDFELIVQQLDDVQQPCMWLEAKCFDRADWWMRCRNCGHVTTICSQHRAVYDARNTSHVAAGSGLYCMICSTSAAPIFYPYPLPWLPL